MSRIGLENRANAVNRLTVVGLILLFVVTMAVSVSAQEAATSNGASVSFQNVAGDVAASNGVSISFQTSSIVGLNQGVSVGFGEPRELEVNPNNPTQGDTVQAFGTNFTPFGNAVLYLIGPDNTERIVGSGAANSSGQVLINYTTSCANPEGYASFRMLDTTLGAYSDTDVIAVSPNTECAAYNDTAFREDNWGLLGSKTPVILIHGLHGNQWPEWRSGHCLGLQKPDCATDPYPDFFYSLIDNLQKSGGGYTNNFKTYTFHYVSDKHMAAKIGNALRDHIESRPEFADKEIIIVAHSTGGLIARHYMLQPTNRGKFAGQLSGARVEKLITLATPHHGTYAADKQSRVDRFNPDVRADVKGKFDWADEIYWKKRNGCDGCVSNPQNPNRISLLWKNMNGIEPQMGLYPNEYPNDWPDTAAYNDRIIAYAGNIKETDPEWDHLRELLIGRQSDDPNRAVEWLIGSYYFGDLSEPDNLAIAAYLIDAVYVGEFRGFWTVIPIPGIPTPGNDGLVPVESGKFLGAQNIMGRFQCPRYNHLDMQIGSTDTCYDELDQPVGTLFDSVRYQITGVHSTTPAQLVGQDRARFGYSNGSWRPLGEVPITTKEIELSNLGDAALQITSLSLAGANADQFVIVNPPTLPLTIGAESCVHITVGFSPTSPGEKTAELRAVNSSSNSVVVVNISATGVPEECDLDFSPASQFMPTSGGSGEVMVGNISCPWTVSAVDDWIHPTALADRVSFTVDANAAADVRYGTMIVSVYGRSYLYSISQDAANAPCWLQLLSDQSVVQREAGSGSFYITAPDSCGWSFQSDSPWLIPSVETSQGSGSIGFTVADNFGLDRSGIITITGSATSAQFTVHQRGASVTGTVTYGNAIGNPAPPRFVKDVSLASTEGTPAVGPVITGTPGTYTLTGFGAGSYTIKPTKPGGSNGAITSNDAARVAQGVVSSPGFVSQNQRFAADTSGNGNVTSNDAALIARFAAGLTGAGNAGQWKFFVTGAPSPLPTAPQTYNDSRTYASVTSSLTGEDYIGILVGEVSGNWNPATHPRPAGKGERIKAKGESEDGGPERNIDVELPQMTASTDKEIIIPVSVQGAADKGIISYEFNLRYDPTVIQPLENPVDVTGTVSRGLFVVANPHEPGLLRVVIYGPMPIDENGVLLNLRFTAVGGVGSISYLKFENLIFNEGEPRVTIVDGQVALF